MSDFGGSPHAVASEPLLSRDEALYRAGFLARTIDEIETRYVAAGEANFHVSCSGHEGLAALAFALKETDWIHSHYRDKALLLARGFTPEGCFHALFCTAESCSAGRQMNAHLSARHLRVMSMVGPVGNNALQAIGVAAEVRAHADQPIVVCCVGDGTTQQGEFLEAVAEAGRDGLRVLFVVEDNGFAISTPTRGRTFFSGAGASARELMGVPIRRMDGRKPWLCYDPFQNVVAEVRNGGGPRIVIFDVDRLSSHTNADDERVYRTVEERERLRLAGDPVKNLREHLIGTGVEERELAELEERWRQEARTALERARATPDPTACHEERRDAHWPVIKRGEWRGEDQPGELTMLETIRETLRSWLASDPRVSLFGEDIEDPKGDVFGITRGLSTDFPGRVRNSPLTESTIVGMSIGRALAGGRPMAFIQFADFLPLAFNQIVSELATIGWRTNGEWQCPVIVFAPCGAYRAGLGPFHAQTWEATFGHVPGLDVVMPSSAADAGGLLQAAFASGRPTLFLYPKACLNDPAVAGPRQVEKLFVPSGVARKVLAGDDLTVVAYGNTIGLARTAAKHLAEAGVSIDLLDLRSVSPWDHAAVLESAQRTGRLLVVHEDNVTFGVGAEIIASVALASNGRVRAARVARGDTLVPCNFANQLEVLPSVRGILQAAARLLDLEITWETRVEKAGDVITIPAQGSSPADQKLIVTRWLVAAGDRIAEAHPIAELEADKAIFEFAAPVGGVVVELLATEGAELLVGEPLLRVRPDRVEDRRKRKAELDAIPRLRRKSARSTVDLDQQRSGTIFLALPTAVTGSGALTNEALAERFRGYTADGILKRTGIARRARAVPGETALSMATAAARETLAAQGIAFHDVNAIICSTTTPPAASPSLACLLLHELGGREVAIPAFDISAACSGYLYALHTAQGMLRAHPDWKIMVVTAEALSTVVNPSDFATEIIFGDAATATLVWSGGGDGKAAFKLAQTPVLSAQGDGGQYLSVGFPPGGYVSMTGGRVFAEAVRRMGLSLQTACANAGLTVRDLEWLVPHQANGRILAALAHRLGVPDEKVVSTLHEFGNTSSSSIPLSLAKSGPLRGRIGLCAFGGGLTYGACVIDGVAG